MLNFIIKKSLNIYLKDIILFKQEPFDTQQEVFNSLIKNAIDTEWGKSYNYSKIVNIDNYQEIVPISDYEDIRPYIERMMKGEKNILWNSPINWFSKSSGTTGGRSKLVPVSQEALDKCHYQGGKQMLALYCNIYPNARIFTGKSLALGGSLYPNLEMKNSYYGDVSSIIMKNLPFWAEWFRSPDMQTALMEKWEDKLEKIARITMNQDITSISGVPSWMLLLLKKICEIKSCSNIFEIWQNFEVFFHGGVCFAPYKEQYAEIIPSDKFHYMETYNASEGYFGIQDTIEKEMLLLLNNGIFYEFIPVNAMGEFKGEAIWLKDVKENTNYALIISTNAGLWRYKIGDTIRFTSTNPHRFVITGRTRNFINAFGEEVIEENATKALEIACLKTNAVLTEYTAAPVFLQNGKNACHEWLIEFNKEPNDLNLFTQYLDESLREINSDYDAKRSNNLLLHEPIIHIAANQTFYNWLAIKNRLGGQYKVPHLSNDRKIMDDIMSRKRENC